MTTGKSAPASSSDNVIYIALIVILFVGGGVVAYLVGAAKPKAPSWKERDTQIAMIDAKLKGQTETIKSLSGSSKCSADSDCRVVGLGAKVCGGYNDFLVYSIADVDEGELLAAVKAFNKTFEEFVNLSLKVPSCGKDPKKITCVKKGCEPVER